MRTYEMHATAKQVQRSSGRSSVAAAAYRSGTRIEDERTGKAHDYTRKPGVEHARLYAPEGAPDWARDRARLWNAVEAKENRSNSTTARELEVGFPAEFDAMQRREAAHAIARELVARYGVAVDVALHEPPEAGDARNHHAHILFTTRGFDQDRPDGWARAKYRDFSNDKATGPEGEASTKGKQTILSLRAFTAETMNRIAERDGLPVRTEHLSFDKREIDREPTRKLGPTATEMERAGKASDRGEANREIGAANDNREAAAELASKAALRAERAEGDQEGVPGAPHQDAARQRAADRAAVAAHPHFPAYAESVAARRAELTEARERLAGITITQRLLGQRRALLEEIEARELNLADARQRLDDLAQGVRARPQAETIEVMAGRSRKAAETAAREAAEREQAAEQHQRDQKELTALTDALASRTTAQRILGAVSGRTHEAKARIAELTEQVKTYEAHRRQEDAFLARRGRERTEDAQKKKDERRSADHLRLVARTQADKAGPGGSPGTGRPGDRPASPAERAVLGEAPQGETDRARRRAASEEDRKRLRAEIDGAQAAADMTPDAAEATPEEKRAASLARFGQWTAEHAPDQDNEPEPDDGLDYD